MKRNYIIPTTTSFAFRTETICNPIVNSVQGGVLDWTDIPGDAGDGI